MKHMRFNLFFLILAGFTLVACSPPERFTTTWPKKTCGAS